MPAKATSSTMDRGISQGPATDTHNRPVVDPTQNVMALVQAASRRQDDLRLASKELNDAKLLHLKEISDLRAIHANELRQAESDRLDSIRQVDREDVNKTALAAQAAIATLAATAATTAETLRTQVATTAQAQQTSFQTAMGEVVKRISALELSSSEGKGKQAVTDPALTALVEEVKHLAASRQQATGGKTNMTLIGGLVMGAVVIITSLVGLVLGLYAAFRPAIGH